jgi:hypothetical protein
MNNDSTPSVAADLPPATTSQEPSADAGDPAAETAASREQQQNTLTPAQKKVQAQTKKKYEFVNSLMTNMDVLIYVELSILYYMECVSFLIYIKTLLIGPQLLVLPPPHSIHIPVDVPNSQTELHSSNSATKALCSANLRHKLDVYPPTHLYH